MRIFLFPFPFCGIVSPDIESAIDSFFLLELEKYCATYFWVPWFQIRNLPSFKVLSPTRECVISPTALKNFSIYLFSEVLLWCVFLNFGGGLVSCLKFTQLSESVGLYLLPNLGSLIHYFFQYVIALLTFSPSETSRKRMLDILLKSQRPPRLCLFFSSLILCCSDWVNSTVFTFTDFILYLFFSTTGSIYWGFLKKILLLYFSCLYFYLICFINSMFLLRFSSFLILFFIPFKSWKLRAN